SEHIAHQQCPAKHRPGVLLHLQGEIKGALHRGDAIPHGSLHLLHDTLHRGLRACDGLLDALFQHCELLCHCRTDVLDIVSDVSCSVSHCACSFMVSTV